MSPIVLFFILALGVFLGYLIVRSATPEQRAAFRTELPDLLAKLDEEEAQRKAEKAAKKARK